MPGWDEIGKSNRVYFTKCPCGHIMLGWPKLEPKPEGHHWRRTWNKFECPKCGTGWKDLKRTFKPFDVEKFIEVFVK